MTGQSSSRSGPDLRLVVLVFVVAAAILAIRALVGRSGQPFFADTDDAMRMVVVRDLLAGQPWFDLTVHRLNAPFGAEIHWSRLIDVPLALIVMAFTPWLGAPSAMVAAGWVWPLTLLALLLWLSAGLAARLVGPQGVLPALVLPVLSPAIIAEFAPGRVDHHNVVIILILATAWAAIEALERPRFALLAGLLAATSLAIAIESVPAIAAAITVFGLVWVLDPARGRTMRGFGLAFGGGALLHLALFRPPARWLEPACDVLSPFYVAVALVVAAVFTLASVLPPVRAPWQRLAVLALAGGAGLGAVLWLFPQCLKGPYGALDPWLQRNWIAGIVEAKPWLANLAAMPGYAIAVGVPVLLAILIVLYRLWRVREGRPQWAVLLAFLLATALVMLVQIRGARLAVMPAIPAAAWLIVTMRARYLARPRLLPALGLLGTWLLFSGIVLALGVGALGTLGPRGTGAVASAQADTDACRVPAAFAELAALPPQSIMSPIDLGAHILLYTPHAVVAAPYHRNEAGVRDAFAFLNDPIAGARALLARRGVTLVVLCPGMPELQGLPSHAPDSFVALLARDDLPDWLVEISPPDSGLRIYALAPD